MIPAPPNDCFPFVYHNGRFISASEANVSIFDRGLLYGDGLFETVRIHNGQPLLWQPHFERLNQGADYLRITIPSSAADLLAALLRLIELNHSPLAILRLTLTRGIGPRGYSTAKTSMPTLLMTLHPAPVMDPEHLLTWRMITARIRVSPDDPLTRFKTCNRLPYILARQEADDAQADDALILNTRGEIVETSCANFFLVRQGVLSTAPLSAGALPGITRACLLQQASGVGLTVCERPIAYSDLDHADALFVTNSSFGVVQIVQLDQKHFPTPSLCKALHRHLCHAVLPTIQTPATTLSQS